MNTSRLAVKLLVLASGFSCFLPACGADAAPNDLAAAQERKAKEIAVVQAEVDGLEAARVSANKAKRFNELKQLMPQLKQARERLKNVTDQPVEFFAQIIADERQAAEEEVRLTRERRQAAEKKAEDERASQLAEQRDEAERLRLSGGCPLKITWGNLFNVNAEAARLGARANMLPDNLVGDSTIVAYGLENRADKPVEAYEILLVFLNGFDEVVQEQVVQGTLIQSGEKRKAVNGWPEIDTAVQVQISAKRAKFSDGDVWQRLPEHKNTGIVVKLPEGPKKIK